MDLNGRFQSILFLLTLHETYRLCDYHGVSGETLFSP
jgi:hypothetical protein